jgi:electron transfer flavoprotein beta subunit
MNIVVCIKPVPDVNIVALDPHSADRLDEQDVVYVVNEPDMVAAEAALRIKDGDPATRVMILSMSPPSEEKLLRRCLALGADEAIQIWDDELQHSDSYATGFVVARALSFMDYDLILCGNKSADSESGQTGYVIAEQLDIPMVSNVTSIEVALDKGEVAVKRKIDQGQRVKMKFDLPGLVTVDEHMNEPRYASLPSLFSALRKGVQRYDMAGLNLSAEQVGLKGSKRKILEMSSPRPRPKRLFVPDSHLTALERMQQVMSGGVCDKQNEILEGESEALGAVFVNFLKQQNIGGLTDDTS